MGTRHSRALQTDIHVSKHPYMSEVQKKIEVRSKTATVPEKTPPLVSDPAASFSPKLLPVPDVVTSVPLSHLGGGSACSF